MQRLKHEISSPSQTGIGSAVQTVYGRQELTVLCPSAVGVPRIANVNCIGVCFSGSPFRAGLASPEEHAPMQLPATKQSPLLFLIPLWFGSKKSAGGIFSSNQEVRDEVAHQHRNPPQSSTETQLHHSLRWKLAPR